MSNSYVLLIQSHNKFNTLEIMIWTWSEENEKIYKHAICDFGVDAIPFGL